MATFRRNIFSDTWLVIKQNPSILVTFFVAACVAIFSDPSRQVKIGTTHGWFFQDAPVLLADLIWSVKGAAILFVSILLQSAASILVANDVVLAYSGERLGMLPSLRQLQVRWLLRYWCYAIGVWVPFLAVVGILFWITLQTWAVARIDLRGLFAVLALVCYVWFYLLLAIGSFVAVLDTSADTRRKILRSLLKPPAIGKLYMFYLLRILVEVALGAVLPVLILLLSGNRPLASVVFALAVLLPFALLRGSAFELTLAFLDQIDFIRAKFGFFFDRQESDAR